MSKAEKNVLPRVEKERSESMVVESDKNDVREDPEDDPQDEVVSAARVSTTPAADVKASTGTSVKKTGSQVCLIS